MIEDNTLPQPPNLKSLPQRQLWMIARTRRDFAAVEEIGNAILLDKPADEQVRRGLARLFLERGAPGQSILHWLALRDQNPGDFEAAFQLACAIRSEGASIEHAISEACPGDLASMRRQLRAVFQEPEVNFDSEIKHVSICGVSFCGSTLMDRLLGGLPSIRSIGESHWLIKAHYAQGYDFADFASDQPIRLVPCSVCGPNCNVLTVPFRRALAANRTRWYFRIAHQLGTKFLISADKNPPKLVENDPLLRFSAVIIFKSPAQAWASQLSKLPSGRSEAFYVSECRKYLDVWSRTYDTFLQRFVPEGKVVFLYFDAFTEAPLTNLRSLCFSLGLPFDENVLRRTIPGHAIGGNKGAMGRLRAKDYGVEILPLPEPDLPVAHLRTIEEHEEADRIFRRLVSAYNITVTGADCALG